MISEVDHVKKLYFSVKEVAGFMGISPYKVLAWVKRFDVPHKVKTVNGRESFRFTSENIELIKQIHKLIHEDKYTLEGVAIQLKKQHEPATVQA